MDKQPDLLLTELCTLIKEARRQVVHSINTAMVITYWEIGKRIVEEEQDGNERATYGKFLLKRLAKDLTVEFGKGFDESNLRYMRLFYKAFPIRDAVRHELSWTHYRLLLRVENEEARMFYLAEAAQCAWSSRQLERQISSFYYQRLLSSQHKEIVKAEATASNDTPTPSNLLKNPYILEFLDLKENKDYLEADLENGLINKLQVFLLELGKGFSFVARQQRITTDVGIILCSQNDKTVVEYSVLAENKQLFSAQYTLYMPTEEELSQILK